MKVIGIGVFVGGLEVIIRFVFKLFDGSGVVFVFLQYLFLNMKFMIGEFLGKYMSMFVIMVYKDQFVKVNYIYVMVENKNIVFFNGRLFIKVCLFELEINLFIDQFFNFLGELFGSYVVGVFLFGIGIDGIRGLCIIKEKGGFVLVQLLEIVKFDGMLRVVIDLKIVDCISLFEELVQDIEYIFIYWDFKIREVGFQDKKQKEIYFDKIV